MKQLCTILLLLLLWPAISSADVLRVLMSFNTAGHQVEKTFKLKTGPTTNQGQGQQSPSTGKGVSTGVLVEWIDSTGSVLAEEVIADPRITHAPTQQEPIPDKLLKTTGVYLLNGPTESRQIRLHFPAVNLSSQLIPASNLLLSLNPG